MPFSTWPPEADEFYRPHSAATPIWQGDVFDRVPIVKAIAEGGPSDQPVLSIERRSVLVITYPCDLYRPGSAELSRVVAVVPLVDETKRGAGVWRGMYDHCPLPRRAADARVQAGNLQVPSTVDGRYLVPRHRVCSLSACGMAFLHQRLVLARSRVITPLEVHEFHLEPVEHERWLWEGWVMSGGDANGYQAWLNTPLPRAGGVVPRLWLDNRQFSFLDGEARRHLQTLGLSPTF